MYTIFEKYEGQYTIIKLKTGLSSWNKVFYQAGYGEKPGPFKLVRDWSKDPYCLIKLPAAGNYVVLAWHDTQTVYRHDIPQDGGTVSVKEKDLLKEQEGDESTTNWQEKPWWTLEEGNCRYIKRGHARAFEAVLKEMFFEPFKHDRRLHLMDFSFPGGCPGHPAGGHSYNRSVDVGYYTLGKDNKTQTEGSTYRDKVWTNGVLDSKKFDVDRNVKFWMRIKEVFPKAIIRVDRRIKEFTRVNFLAGDPPAKYKHDTHMHIDFGEEINWKAFS